MRRIAAVAAIAGLIFASTQKTEAHQPEGVLYFLWQWPAGLPILDHNLSEWEVLPEEYWFSNADYGTKIFQSDGSAGRVTTAIDPASLDFRYAVSANAADNRFYFAYERFDNAWTAWADIEPKIDADHSGGLFWEEEGMTEEEAKRAKSRGAQPYHLFFSEGGGTPGFQWSWNWQTAADWYEDPRFMDAAYAFTGEPLSEQEYFVRAEFYLSGFDDFKWDDPDYSFDNIHDIQEGEIAGIAVEVYDTDPMCDSAAEGAECISRWSLATFNETFGNADFFTDFLVMPLDEEALATAVEEDSWGAIKASMAK